MDTITRVFDLIAYALKHYEQDRLFNQKVGGQWKHYSTREFCNLVNQSSLGLLRLGISPTDRVGIIAPNRPEWNILDFAIQQIGAISVPVYPTMTVDDYRFIIEDSGMKLVLVGSAELGNKVREASSHLPAPPQVFCLEHCPDFKHWSEISLLGQGESVRRLETYKENITPDDLLTIIYTSGTTGTPKGVMLTHANLVSNFTDSLPAVPVMKGHRALSFLPLCHVYERMIIYLYMRVGLEVWYAESMETISDNLKEVKPHIFTTVPRLLEKVYDKIVQKGHELTGVKKALFFWALQLGHQFEPGTRRSWWYETRLDLANKLIFSKWREALGGNIVCVVVGSAALQPRLARVFWGARIKVLEGYGLTETSPVVAVNRVDESQHRVGTVGMLIDNVEVRIAADGEIMVKGPNIMKGYYKRPDLTEQVIDADGWLHTGDIGELVEGRFLKITDRKKEMFKTSGGKYVAPQVIENKLKEILVIEQAMVVGEGRKHPAALIVPNFASLKDWCALKGIGYTTDAQMIVHPEVLTKFDREIEGKNQGLGQWEKIKKFKLLPRLWTIDAGELTPTLKLKRKVLLQRYAAEIDGLYEGGE